MTRPALPTVVAVLCAAALATSAQAQTPPPATPPAATAPKPQAAQPRAAASAPARASAVIMVTDQSGVAAPDVHVTMTGPVEREGTTGRDGTLRLQALRAGGYRLRFESPGFVTLERDVAIKAGTPAEVDVALDRETPRQKVAELPPPPVPAPTSGRAGIAPDPNASVEMVALPDWIERNLVGRSDPLKETVVGRTPVTTATVIQVREPLKDRVRADGDEMLYVIAGEGVLRAKGRDVTLEAGAFVVVPRGVSYSVERRGRNPLIALSILGQ